jgi:hypothetical protein
MKKRGSLLLFMIALAAIGLIGYASLGYGAHTPGAVILKDADGLDIAPGSSTPYSPKQTCGVCHNYESDTAVAVKNHGTGLPTYEVPYPKHGVTAGYHFQQGRNLDWGDAQREFFHQADFTSSGGMYGKY